MGRGGGFYTSFGGEARKAESRKQKHERERQGRRSYQPRATPWVYQPKTLSALKARFILRVLAPSKAKQKFVKQKADTSKRTPRASFIPAQGNALGSSAQNPLSAESAIHPSSSCYLSRRRGVGLRRAVHRIPPGISITGFDVLPGLMKQAVGLRQNNNGTMNPGRCPGLV